MLDDLRVHQEKMRLARDGLTRQRRSRQLALCGSLSLVDELPIPCGRWRRERAEEPGYAF